MADETIYRSLPKTSAEARTLGLKRYFTGKPCPRGHVAPRFASIHSCCECARIKAAAYAKENRERLRRLRPQRRPDEPKQKRQRRHSALTKIAGRPRPQACEVCGGREEIHFDHCHSTGRFRGWICQRCNVILGMARDDPALLRKLADYLDRVPRPKQFDLVELADAMKQMGRYLSRRKGKWGRPGRNRSWA